MHRSKWRQYSKVVVLIVSLSWFLVPATGAEAQVMTGVSRFGSLNTSNFANSVGSQDNAPPLMVRAKRGGPVVRSGPGDDFRPLSGLYYDTYLPVTGQQTDSSGKLWYSVRLWGCLDGWIRADQIETGDPPLLEPLSAPTPLGGSPPPSQESKVIPLVAEGTVRDLYHIRDSAASDGGDVGVAQPGDQVKILGFKSDPSGSIWYQIEDRATAGWIWGDGLDLTSSSALPRARDNGAVASVRGKGMWLPVALLAMANPDAIVAAAKELGLTHVYLEAADSGRGFFGEAQANRLLAPAHASGLKVIAWLLTSLDNVPSDLALSRQVAGYRSESGDSFDGVAPDIEDNMSGADVRTFSEILRAQLGPKALIVGVIYPAGSYVGVHHPVAGILSRSVDALAPMAYWHVDQRPYDSPEIASFIKASVSDIQSAVGDATFPVDVIGQAYDGYGRNGTGLNNPSGDEVAIAISAARAGGAFGVSLFQWGTTTPSEWDALRQSNWSL